MSSRDTHKRYLKLLLLLLMSLVILATAQGQQETPEYRVEVDIVPVDVVVTDGQENAVTDLTIDDFVILENGVPQTISHFTLQTFNQKFRRRAQEDIKKSAAPETVPSPEAAPPIDIPENRTFLIMLGRGRHNKFDNLKKLSKFLREGLDPNDQVAVMAYNRTTDFTTDHESMAKLIDRYRVSHEEIEGSLEVRLTGLAALYGSKEVPRDIQSKINQVFDSSDVVSSPVFPADVENPAQSADERELMEAEIVAEREAMLSAADPSYPTDNFSELRTMELELMTDLPFDEYMANRAQTDQELMNIFGALEYLRIREGEKHLVFLTEKGLFLPDMEDDKSLAAMASDARVRIHNLHTGGVDLGAEVTLKQPMGGRSEFRSRSLIRLPHATSDHAFALSSLRNVSSLTGGRVFIGADIDRALESIEETTGAVYLLGYMPSNTDFDGAYRRIRVRTKREDLRVQARGGYYARENPVPYDREQLLLYSRTVGAATFTDPVEDILFGFGITEPTYKEGFTQVNAMLRIKAKEEMFAKEGDLYKGKLAITFFFFSEKGELVGDQWDTMQLKLEEAQYRQMLDKGIPISRGLSLRGEFKKGTFKAVVYDASSDRVGSKSIEIEG